MANTFAAVPSGLWNTRWRAETGPEAQNQRWSGFCRKIYIACTMNLRRLHQSEGNVRSRRRDRAGGFTLAELLVVMAIIMVVASLSVPAMKGITEGGSLQNALGKITGTLETARTYAVANNTHTWVAFSDNASTGESVVRMVALASRSGADINPDDTAQEFRYPDDGVTLILPIETLGNIRLDGQIPAGNKMRGDSRILPEAEPLERFPLTAGEAACSSFKVGVQAPFGRAIHFLPSGEAKIKDASPEAVEMVVVPERAAGVDSEQDNLKAAVIRISGLTGQAAVYTAR